MPNNTTNDYKEAIRVKFEREKDDGIYSDYLRNPSQANLRDLCWRIFKSDIINSDDLAIYYNFFKFNFDPNNENTSTSYTDKFKKVGDFLKRVKEPARIDTVNLAGILVGFELRPFQKFNKNVLNEGKESINGSNNGEPSTVLEGISEDHKIPKPSVDEKKEEGEDKNAKSEPSQKKPEETKGTHPFKSFIEKICQKFTKRVWWTMFVIALVFACGFLISHFVFPEKQCMQWNKDHYDIVSCDLEVNGMVTLNGIEPLDMSRVSLRKIKVCDTTTFFKNGQAIVFYAKNGNLVECFNQMAKNPENTDQYLKPITKHIIDEHLSNKPCK